MDGFRGKLQESERAAVVTAENEAESKQEEEERDARERFHLDTCPVCHLNFHSREPKLLPCLHSFCGKCVPKPRGSAAAQDAEGDSAAGARECACTNNYL